MGSLASAAAAVGNRVTRVLANVAASSSVLAAVTAFVSAQLVTFLVVVLVVWSSGSVAGHPCWSDFMRRFGLWDGANSIAIATHGSAAGPLDLVPGHPGRRRPFPFTGRARCWSRGAAAGDAVDGRGITPDGGEFVAGRPTPHGDGAAYILRAPAAGRRRAAHCRRRAVSARRG